MDEIQRTSWKKRGGDFRASGRMDSYPVTKRLTRKRKSSKTRNCRFPPDLAMSRVPVSERKKVH